MDEIEPESDSTVLLPSLKPYEIYLFNLYIFFTLLIILCLIAVIIPDDFISELGIIFPQKYWFIAIPTHILTTLLGLTICVKGFELINTIDDPPVEDYFAHILPEEEMMKEINYKPEEGILPDAGDIDFNVGNKIDGSVSGSISSI